MEGKIIIRAKKRAYLTEGKEPIVRLSVKAYNKLVDLSNECGLPIAKIASQIIEQGSELVEYEIGGDKP